MRIFYHGKPEDILLWYTKTKDLFNQKLCKDITSNFVMTDLLLSRWAKQNIFLLKTETCDCLVTDTSTVNTWKNGHTEDTFEKTLEKVRNYASKKFTAWYQVSDLGHKICKLIVVTTWLYLMGSVVVPQQRKLISYYLID